MVTNNDEFLGRRDAPWAVNASFQSGVIVSLHDDLSIFPGIDEAGLDGGVSINVAAWTR